MLEQVGEPTLRLDLLAPEEQRCTDVSGAVRNYVRPEAAFRWLQKARQANTGFDNPVPWLAAAYAGLGLEAEARTLINEYLTSGRGFTISGWNKRNPRGAGVLAEQRARIAETLKRLGVPEGRVETGSVQ